MTAKKVFSLSRDEFLGLIVLISVLGSLILAIIDKPSRPMFLDLTKFAVGTYVGLLIPRSGSSSSQKFEGNEASKR